MSRRIPGRWLVGALAAFPVAQKGDVAGEAQPPLPAELLARVARALTPEEELATFQVEPGLRVELVACEPLVEAPVQAVFDGDGRLWVVEMRGYMRDVDGTNELAPIGRISVLHDDDGDGRMDRAVRFLEGLVLPRSVAPTRDGALVIAPPHVLYCRDTDGDGVADESDIVDTGLAGLSSPEYGPNGLLPTLDNAFACARHEVRYRFVNGGWTKQSVVSGGQWGIAEDDAGRLLFDTNSDVLRAHLVPAREAAWNPFLDTSRVADVGLARDQSVRPIHATTAVNRAYRPGWLVNGRIVKADGICGALVERGGLFPADLQGDVFVCEPVGNLVHWLEMQHEITGENAQLRAEPQPGARPLLASTDERFRPVNLASGPDGAVYVVDMYRGLLQHRQFVTTFLREQTLARGLVEPLDRGRIWRVVPVDAQRVAVPKLSELSSDSLLPFLGSPNASLRREAQRHFVEDDWDEAIVLPKLRAVVASSTNPRARIHALWALDGRGALDEPTLLAAIADADADVRLQALRAATGRAAPSATRMLAIASTAASSVAGTVESTAESEREDVLRQRIAALVLSRQELNDRLALRIARGKFARPTIRHALLLGAEARGLDVLDEIFADSAASGLAPGECSVLVRDLAAAMVREGRAHDVTRLVEIACAPNTIDPITTAILEGVSASRPRAPRRVRIDREPAGLRALAAPADGSTSKLARDVLDAVAWPGRTDMPEEVRVAALTPEELARFERGRAIYAEVCAACHQTSGAGAPGIAPPLRDSDFVLGDPVRAAAIVLAGLRGPIDVNGRTWDLEMPAWRAGDDELASVLTFVRRSWGNAATAVTDVDVRAARERVAQRGGPLDAAALAAWKPRGPVPGYRAIGDALWSIEDRAIHGRVGGGAQSFLASEQIHGDFVLETDVKLLGDGNSGIQVRSHQKDDGRVFGYQIEIDPSARAWSGGLYDEGRRGWLQDLSGNDAGRAAFKKSEWNHYRIECEGPSIRAWVNGVVTADLIDPLDVEGFVALQVHSGRDTDVLWRDLRVEDRGTRAWLPFPDSKATRIESPEGITVRVGPEMIDGAVRLRVRSRGVIVGARESQACFESPMRRAMAPGLEVLEHGYHVRVADLPLAEGESWDAAHDVVVTTWGDRIAVHVDGRSVIDMRDAAHSGGIATIVLEPSAQPGDLERAEYLGPAAR